MPPQGRTRDPRRKPGWGRGRGSSPSSEGSIGPERQEKMNEDDTNVYGAVEPNANLEFGSETVHPFTPPRVKKSISDWDDFGSMSPIMRNKPRTEAEIPPSALALVSTPPPSHFREMDQGDPVDESGTRSPGRDHVRVCDLPRTPSRYVRNSSRLGVGISFTSRSHSGLSSVNTTMDMVDVVDGVRARSSDRRVGGLRKVSGEEQRAQFRYSPVNTHLCIGRVEGQGNRRELPKTAHVGVGANHPDLSLKSLLSDSEVRSCSPTAGSLSPRTEVSSGSRFSAPVLDNKNATPAPRWRLRSDGLNEMMAGKTRVCAGVVDGCQPNGQLSVAGIDGLDDGEEELCWAGRTEPFTRADALSRSGPSQFSFFSLMFSLWILCRRSFSRFPCRFSSDGPFSFS